MSLTDHARSHCCSPYMAFSPSVSPRRQIWILHAQSLDGVVFAGRSLDEQRGHLNFVGDQLRETCQSYCAQDPSETGQPSPLSSSCLLDAIVATGRTACAREWLDESVLTSVRSHDEASDLDPHVLSATFSQLLHGPRHARPYQIARDAELALLDCAFHTLYGRQADGGEFPSAGDPQ